MNLFHSMMIALVAAALFTSPSAQAAQRESKTATTQQRAQAAPEAHPASNRASADQFLVKVVSPDDGLRLTLTSVDGQSHRCITPCAVKLAPGELKLALPWREDSLTVTIEEASVITLSPPSQAKIIGGAALVVTGTVLFVFAIVGVQTGKVGFFPAIILGGLGGGSAGLGEALFRQRNGTANVEPWKDP